METYIDKLKTLFENEKNGSPEYFCEKHENGIPENLDTMSFIKLNTSNAPEENALAFIWYDETYLHVGAVMIDSNVFNYAEPKNDMPFLRGDVMEFFFQAPDHENYYELHLAPNLATLEYSIPQEGKIGECKHEELVFESDMKTEVGTFSKDNGIQGWWGHMIIPRARIDIAEKLDGARFSVCRYNYNKAIEDDAEKSSVTNFPTGGFHQPKLWKTLKTS
jgi:hypothetical protein